MSRLRIATRASRQATTQASLVAAHLEAEGIETELVLVDTFGDQTQAAEVPLHSIGGQGVFVKAVQEAVLSGRCDLAVHSAKDLPTTMVPGLDIAAFCQRRTPTDALVGRRLEDLATGSTVATGSVRRRSQLSRMRPDLTFAELRGNIDTRLTKIPTNGAIVVATAALELLDLTEVVAEELDPAEFVPAVGQGCVAVECRDDDPDVWSCIAALDHRPTRRAVEIERAYLAELGTGCASPVGAHCDGVTLATYLAADPHQSDGASWAPSPIVAERIELVGDHATDLATAATLARNGLDHIAGVIDQGEG